MDYLIRDEAGQLIARVNRKVADSIMAAACGKIRPYTPQGATETIAVFEITNDSVVTVGDLELYLWAKTKLIPA